MSTATDPPSTWPASSFKLYYPPGVLGRAEPIRLLFTEAGQGWEEPWAKQGLTHEQAMEEMERMRERLPQPVFGLPWLEHYRVPPTATQEQKEQHREADTIYLCQSPVRSAHHTPRSHSAGSQPPLTPSNHAAAGTSHHTSLRTVRCACQVIMHYVAAECADGRFLPSPYTTENAHRGMQLAEDVEDATVSPPATPHSSQRPFSPVSPSLLTQPSLCSSVCGCVVGGVLQRIHARSQG